MFDARKYGIPDDVSGNIKTLSDAVAWMDENPQEPTEKKPVIRSIGTPEHASSFREAVWKRFTKEQAEGYRVGEPPEWEHVVALRRRFTVVMSLVLTVLMTALSLWLIILQQFNPWVIGVYAIGGSFMNYFMCQTFVKTVLGSWHALRGKKGNPWHPAHTECEPLDDSRVAILFPVYHEDVPRVAGGIAAVWESIVAKVPQEHQGKYDIFLISDSRKAGYHIAEKAAVFELRKRYPEARFYYRRRPFNDNAKLGNVSDFCRRWGRDYPYMFVMDADSIVAGDVIHTTHRMMEGNHRLGILQTNPRPALRRSLFGRMMQFSGHLYGCVMSYSHQAMHMGHANYIGHNAMIRTELFIQHCTLPTLDGVAPWGGKPLSHDIIEAALMARAGYEVWFLPELRSSWEEIPADIMTFMLRERRWMQGNLQHLRFLWMEGITATHFDFFINGMCGYLAAPVWASFLTVSVYGMISFMEKGKISIDMMGTYEIPAIMMLGASLTFMFLPRILSFIVNVKTGACEGYGGRRAMLVSMVLETVFSLFFAPLMMVFMTRFVWLWLRRKSVTWGTQQRDDTPISWQTAYKEFGWVSIIGVIATGLILWRVFSIPAQHVLFLAMMSKGMLTPSSALVWFMPILMGMVFAPVIAKIGSMTFNNLLERRLFCIPEEIDVPMEFHVMARTRADLMKSLPDVEDFKACVDYAAKSESFYAGQRPSARPHKYIAQKMVPLINDNIPLDEKDIFMILRDRLSFDTLHNKYAA